MNRRLACIDVHALEPRRLFSANWNTVDDFVQPLANPQAQYPESYADPYDMAADANGGIYACGESWDHSSDHGYAILRYSSGAGAPWQTIAAIPDVGPDLVARFDSVALAQDGSVYLCGFNGGTFSGAQNRVWKGTWDAAHASFSLVELERQTTFFYEDIAVDASGNVFVLGEYTSNNRQTRWVVRKKSPAATSFATVDDFALSNTSDAYPSALTTVLSGPNAGVYATGGTSNGRWIVRKGINAGTTWSTVDSFQLDAPNNASARAAAITAGDDGSVYVAGRASVRVQTGGTAKKPIYATQARWYMRSSSNGGSSWTNHDVFPQSASASTSTAIGATAVVTDQFGKVYVAGEHNGAGVVRSNATGAWSTSDDWSMQTDWSGSTATCMTRDSAGVIYVAGRFGTPQNYDEHWLVRSTTPTANLNVVPDIGTLFNDDRIGTDDDRELVQIVDQAT